MQEVDGKKFPTAWSDLALEFEVGKMDDDKTIDISDIPKWLGEYHALDETYSYSKVEDLYKRGCELNCYLGCVYARVEGMRDQWELSFDIAMATKKSNYTDQQAKTDAAKERMIMTEEDYQVKKNLLVRMNTMLRYVEKMEKHLIKALDGLQIRLRKEAKEPPTPPLAR